MTSFLIGLLERHIRGASEEAARERLGKAAGVIGILSNFLLFSIKLAAGLISGSIAITTDAINNLSDSASSGITLAGFYLAGIPADEKHPYGHARFEYISGLAVAVFVLLIGVEFLQSAVDKIRNPTPVSFTPLVAAILLLSVVLKLWQGSFNKKLGFKIQSGALAATAADSRNDALSTASVLIAAVAAHYTGWALDGWMGAAVACFVLFSGVNLIRDTLDPLLGMAPSSALVADISRKILSYSSVIGIHDLMVHNYGPERCFASAHVEVPANQDILVSHDIIDNIERDIAHEMNINLVIHLDPIVIDDERTNAMRAFTARIVRELDPILATHDFRMVEGKSHTNFIFDVVAPPRYKMTDDQLRKEIDSRVRRVYHTVYCVVTVDRSYISTVQGSPSEGD